MVAFFVAMGIQAILGQKVEQSQRFLADGTRIPVTMVQVGGNVVAAVKTYAKNGYDAIQLGFGSKKNPNHALQGIMRKANIKTGVRFFKEVRLSNSSSSAPSLGTTIKASEIFKPGDIVDVIGVSKGKGFAGVVKRHHFKGGPRTHGQSDRERAPGSIGQTTTPGRVYRGKRMAGRMGHTRTTIKNLKVVDLNDNYMLLIGLVPGSLNSLVMVKKVGEDKKFVPLYREEPKESKEPKEENGRKEVKS